MFKKSIIALTFAATLFFVGIAAASVNVNTASADQLQQLDGVGPVTARAIIKDRKTNGKYDSLSNLKRVDGIGPKTIKGFKKDAVVESDAKS